MSPAPQLMTLDDYLATAETVKPAELAFGVLRVADAPLPRHQSTVAQLFRLLDAHVRARDLGEVWLAPLDVILDEARALVVQPDLLFISRAREWIVQDRVRGAPDLVVEVLSPAPRVGRIHDRLEWFAEYGVRECWLVQEPDRAVEVLEFAARAVSARRVWKGREPIVSRVLPELAIASSDIFERR